MREANAPDQKGAKQGGKNRGKERIRPTGDANA
jgi:hypothetical protein